MGIVSGEVLLNGGRVVGVVPRAMVAGGGEGKKAGSPKLLLNEAGREKVLFFFLYYTVSPLNRLFVGGNCMCFLCSIILTMVNMSLFFRFL